MLACKLNHRATYHFPALSKKSSLFPKTLISAGSFRIPYPIEQGDFTSILKNHLLCLSVHLFVCSFMRVSIRKLSLIPAVESQNPPRVDLEGQPQILSNQKILLTKVFRHASVI